MRPGDIGSWVVRIQRPLGEIGGNLLIFRVHSGGYEVLGIEKGELTSTRVERGNIPVVPTMRFDSEDDLRSVVAAFMQLGDEMGLPKPDENYVKGKLEATERHLADTRKLLKL